jgi:DNA polymerase III subunit delta'
VAVFADVPEQPEAKRLLEAALEDGPAHAYLFHGPAGVGKRAAARAFAAALLGDARRVHAGIHPDLRVIEALGEMIRIDEIRSLHHDLHMRPFEEDRRVYLIFDAHRMNDDAAASLLKDLEEPPAYATLVLVADELGPLPETIRSRCQLVPFRRLSRGAVEGWIAAHGSGLAEDDVGLLARVAGGRLDRAARLLDEEARSRRTALLDAARSAYLDETFEPAAGAGVILDSARTLGALAWSRE